jgi:serine/threonine protein kinase
LPLQIGIGTFSVVHEVKHRDTEAVYAAKRVSRKDLHPSDAVALHDEIAALQQTTDCEHIVKIYDVYDEPDFTYLVLEVMKGGDLIDRIIEKRHYTEFDAKEVSRKLLLGVEYCHNKKIANRNLKPENLLLVSIMGPKKFLFSPVFGRSDTFFINRKLEVTPR